MRFVSRNGRIIVYVSQRGNLTYVEMYHYSIMALHHCVSRHITVLNVTTLLGYTMLMSLCIYGGYITMFLWRVYNYVSMAGI